MNSEGHRFVWDETNVAAFWDRISARPESEYQYFALQRGRSVLNYLCGQIDASAGPIVDIGCGRGHMLGLMLKKNIQCLGLDTSSQSLISVNAKLSSDPNFLGVQLMEGFDGLPLKTESVGGVLLMETIEHLFEDKIPSLMMEIKRVLRPGGFVFVTTPNNENLSAKEVSCENCRCVFHPVQHMRSLNAASLERIMDQLGFRKKVCKPVIFIPDWRIYFKQNIQISCPACGSICKPPQNNILNRFLNLQIRNLIYLGYR